MNLLEHDPNLICNRRSASHFCELIRQSPDNPEKPGPGEAADDRPLARSAHIFVVKDDVEGRDDPALSKTLTGSLDECFAELARLNTHRRAGVFLQLDAAECILSESVDLAEHERDSSGMPRRAFPIEPSLSIFYGRGPSPDFHPLAQWAWLVDGTLTVRSARLLRPKVLLRVAGFWCRRSTPALVMALGSREYQGQIAVRYTGDVLARNLKIAA